jgi:hypothetical protein
MDWRDRMGEFTCGEFEIPLIGKREDEGTWLIDISWTSLILIIVSPLV